MPNVDSFNYIFSRVIKEIKDNTPNPKLASSYIKQLEEDRDAICGNYEVIRDDVKKKCMEFKDERRLLDRHKFTAAFMIAFLNKLKVEEKDLSKERAAISIGQLMLKIIIHEENRHCEDGGILASIERNGFIYPKCIRDDKPYWYNWALGIHYGRLTGHLSVLSLSNILFWIERYNRALIGDS
jgi:hypothetical protein